MKIKTYLPAAFVAATTIHANAQLNINLPSINSAVRSATEKVLTAYTKQFETIKGDTLSYDEHSVVYVSTIKPEGALECTLTEHLYDKTPDYGWKAIMFRSENFDAAVKKYKSLYQQLKTMKFCTGPHNYKMDGEFDPVNDTKNFYSTVLQPDTPEEKFQKLRLEILLEGDTAEWTVTLLVYEKIHEDSEGGLFMKQTIPDPV